MAESILVYSLAIYSKCIEYLKNSHATYGARNYTVIGLWFGSRGTISKGTVEFLRNVGIKKDRLGLMAESILVDSLAIYSKCIEYLKHSHATYGARNYTVIGLWFGSRGTISKETVEFLRNVRIKKDRVGLMAESILVDSLAIYSKCIEYLKNSHDTYGARNYTVIGLWFGSRGTISKGTVEFLRNVGIKKDRVGLMAESILVDSLAIYSKCIEYLKHSHATYGARNYTVIGLWFGSRGTISKETVEFLRNVRIKKDRVGLMAESILVDSLAIYSKCIEYLKNSHDTYGARNYTVIGLWFGSRGTISKGTVEFLRNVGIKKDRVGLMAESILVDSLAIYSKCIEYLKNSHDTYGARNYTVIGLWFGSRGTISKETVEFLRNVRIKKDRDWDLWLSQFLFTH